MASVTIRDVPDETRDELAARAALTGRSLQEYLRAKLIELGRRPDPEVLLARVRERKLRTGSQLSASRSSITETLTAGEPGGGRLRGGRRIDRCGNEGIWAEEPLEVRRPHRSPPATRGGRQRASTGRAVGEVSADSASLAHGDLLELSVDLFA